METAARTDARLALLGQLIDHAPMFPPARLPLEEALVDHEAARSSDAAWLVNRFVVAASRLPELPALAPPRLSVVLDAAPSHDARIEALELAHDAAFEAGPWGNMLPGGPARPASSHGQPAEVYVEHPTGPAFGPWVEGLAGTGTRAKIRCGGAVVPAVADLAAAIRACRSAGVPFKATAGLHHAVRNEREHGFLNLLAAVVFGDEEAALEESDAAAFGLDGESFRWRDRTASAEEVATVRRELFVSIGSCSFFEPVDELRALGLL